MSNELEILRSVSILRELETEELAGVRDLMKILEFAPKSRILEEGKPVHQIYIVFDGIVHVRRLAQKREMLMGRLGPGGFFGEINLFDPGLATASIYAMKQTQVGAIPYEDFRAHMAANPTTGYKIVSAMMTEMSRRLRQTSARLVHSVYWSSAAAGEG